MRRNWTDHERVILEALYPMNPTEMVCEFLERPYDSVRQMATRWGVKKANGYRKFYHKYGRKHLKNG